jgi:hypothetical protein
VEKGQVHRESLGEVLRDTVLANEEKLILHIVGEIGCQVLIMEPVLTLVALNHELIYVHRTMGLLAVAVTVEIVVVIEVSLVLIVQLVIEELAGLGHASVPTVATEVQLRVQLYNVMPLVTVYHASNAEAVWLEKVRELAIVGQTTLYLFSLIFW